MITDNKTKTVKPGDFEKYCSICSRQLNAGDPYHWVKSRSAGTRIICMACAEELTRPRKETAAGKEVRKA